MSHVVESEGMGIGGTVRILPWLLIFCILISGQSYTSENHQSIRCYVHMEMYLVISFSKRPNACGNEATESQVLCLSECIPQVQEAVCPMLGLLHKLPTLL